MQSCPKKGSQAYDTSKTALNHLIRELAIKLGPHVLRSAHTHQTPDLPQDCAGAIVWLAGDQSGKTTGHVIPVDGGLSEAYLR